MENKRQIIRQTLAQLKKKGLLKEAPKSKFKRAKVNINNPKIRKLVQSILDNAVNDQLNEITSGIAPHVQLRDLDQKAVDFMALTFLNGEVSGGTYNDEIAIINDVYETKLMDTLIKKKYFANEEDEGEDF